MCGIAGAVEHGRTRDAWNEALRGMSAAVRHRGPDDDGVWIDEVAGAGLAHRRLSILDLSAAGHQPMVSRSGRYVVAYNGEVYNFEALRHELGERAGPWRGRSDTEVVLAAVEAWGLEAALGRCVGMFAMALWDRRERRMHLVRDRLGIKPLYWARCGGAIVFGSELGAIASHPGFVPRIDRRAVASYLRFGYVPAPRAIYEGAHKVPPGVVATVASDAHGFATDPVERRYWSMSEVANRERDVPPAEAADRLEEALRIAVRDRLVADVPLGAFLSGGIDSSVVVGAMRAESTGTVRTFTIGFAEEAYDEARHAAAVAAHLGTEHVERTLSPADALGAIPDIPAVYDEPFADASQLPTMLVCRVAREHVTVCLSGDGGDELFAGYKRYALCRTLAPLVDSLPRRVRAVVATALHAAPGRALDTFFFWLQPWFRKFGSGGKASDKMKKLAEILSHPDVDRLYVDLLSHWKRPAEVVIGGGDDAAGLTGGDPGTRLYDLTERMTYHDAVTYLPDDILVKVDRASMAVGLEARVPLLDHRVVELAWRMPTEAKVDGGRTKLPLRTVLERWVPPGLFERPKMGFGVPIDVWLRGPLRDWAESLLSRERLRREGLLEPDPIREKWEQHVAGERDWQYYLWDVLVLQAWLEHRGLTCAT